MIKIRKKRRGSCPPVLDRKGLDKIAKATNEIKVLYDSDPDHFNDGSRKWETKDIDSAIYGHKNIKDQLVASQYGKCAFCEQNIVSLDYGDIEHFRPKRGWLQNTKKSLQGPGYYWLSYDYENLLFACKICNERNKKNLFPVRRPEKRAANHHLSSNLNKEKPFFINPAKEDPRWLIRFHEAEAIGIDKNHRGKKTINSLGLNRKGEKGISDLFELRNTHFATTKNTYWMSKQKPGGTLTQDMIDEASALMENLRCRASHFSAMINDNFPK